MSSDVSTVPLVALTKGEAVYRELARRILDGTLEPGSSVNQEALAAALGVSITPLREAVRRLDAEGLVIVEPNRSLTIAPLSVHEVRELYAVRLQLDPFAAGLAAANAAPETIERLMAMARRHTEETTRGRLLANREFHRTIYRASANRTLGDLLDRLWDQTDRYRLIAVRDDAHERKAEQEHKLIAAAIRDRNSELATELMRAHVAATLKVVEAHANLR
jgi:DNA-binding GntR family transcriptional regulator